VLSRRKWTPSEEDRFIDIWLHNLHLFATGRKLTYIYSELELYYREVGLEINAQGIKSKMETLKRKYYTSVYFCQMENRLDYFQDFSLLYSDNEDQSTSWKHFDTMALIVAGSNKESKDTEWKDYTQPPKTSRKKFRNPFISLQLTKILYYFLRHHSFLCLYGRRLTNPESEYGSKT